MSILSLDKRHTHVPQFAFIRELERLHSAQTLWDHDNSSSALVKLQGGRDEIKTSKVNRCEHARGIVGKPAVNFFGAWKKQVLVRSGFRSCERREL